ncbi:unnamed protein product [Lymnaea stagnalis]|uniref:Transglutaminase-like domain-containing protein n=1 Tax=Lymnaea stagnalis TaxID=6523 RepID=A0AAV2HFR7_LYMST
MGAGASICGSTHVQPDTGRWVQPTDRRDSNVNVIIDPDPKTTLTAVSVELNIKDNSELHHTNKYAFSIAKTKLIVRRGQPFVIDVEFSKDFNEKSDGLKIIFETGKKPLATKGTSVEITPDDEDGTKEWKASIKSKKDKALKVSITAPPSCFIGKWNVKIDVVRDSNIYRLELADPIYVIFNPWCKDDTVYMADANLLKEYVLNETGQIYYGSQSAVAPRPWNFGQFESCVLEVAIYLLDSSELKWPVRGSPVSVVRKISALVNSADDSGVLTGNWSGDYSDGRSPLSWTGSAAILEEFWKSKRPVKYGQCWVFSGLSTTICRTLGIPARSVSNFQSAHDSDGSITIDFHYTSKGELDDSVKNDSIWNFHVWNEAWMSRPELTSGYGGWQAFDATPQETSEGVYCCGPVPVAAIKLGEVTLPYDGPFVFAEVNADRVHWKKNKLGQWECISIDKNAVGKKMSTKAANSNEREDVTSNYKPEEGSAEERAAVLRANQTGSNRKDIYKQKPGDVDFNLVQDRKETLVGDNFQLKLKMSNKTSNKRTVSGRMEVRTMYYTGVLADLVKSVVFTDVDVSSNPGKIEIEIEAKEGDYSAKLRDCCMLDVTIWAVVKETEQYFVKKEDFRLLKPNLAIKAPSSVKLGEEFDAEVSFTNPLNQPLTKCFLVVDGLAQSREISQSKVSAKSNFTAKITIKPTKKGNCQLIVIFNSQPLEDIHGSQQIKVT